MLGIASGDREVERRVGLRHRRREPDVEEGLGRLAVDRDDAVAGPKSVRDVGVERFRHGSRRLRRHGADGGRGEANAREEGDEEEDDRQREVRRDSGENDDPAPEDGRRREAAGVLADGFGVAVLLSEHADVSADRQRAERVLRLAEAERLHLMVGNRDRAPAVPAHHDGVRRARDEAHAPAVAHEAGAHADREAIGADARPLRGEEVPELMDEDQEAEAEQDEDEAGERAHVNPFDDVDLP